MHKCVALLVLVAACGDDGVHHLADAPPAPDGPSIDAPTTGVVDLTVIDNGQPITGVDVYFQSATGALVAKVATDAQGVASATMDVGGYVTVLNPFPDKRPSDDLRTFGGVKPGDHLKLHREFGTGISITFTGPLDVNASSYVAYTSCGSAITLPGNGGGSGSASAPTVTWFIDTCATADFAIVSYDGNGMPSQYVVKTGVAVSDGGTVDLSAETFTSPVPSVNVAWSNAPAAANVIEYANVLATARGPLISENATSDVASGAATAVLSRPPVTGGVSITTTRPLPTNGFADQFVVDWAPAAASISVDLAGALLGPYSGAPSVSAATRTVTWATDAGATPDLAWATVHGSREGTPLNWTWQITMPFGATTFTLPLLPAGLDQYNLTATDTADVDELITAKVPGGYDAVRAELLSSQSPVTFAVGANGRISYQAIYQPPRLARVHGGWRVPRVYSRR